MKRYDFFVKALQAQAHLRTAWVISIFSLISEAPDAWKLQNRPGKPSNYPYRVVQTPTGHFFVNPDNPDELIQIEDAPAGKPIFEMKEEVKVNAGVLPNLSEDIHTTYGNLLFNAFVIVYAFGDKVKYIEGDVKASALEDQLVEILLDTPPEGAARDPKFIYVDEFVKFLNAMFALSAFSQLCVPACSPKSITAPPGIHALRDKLLKENKDRLHDPAVIAKIDEELVQHLRDYLKDDVSMGFLTNKSFDVVRKKLYLMGGAEQSLESDTDFNLVTRSLSEGWSMKDFPALCTGSRAGSFNRGAQTELGGEAVKWLFRSASNLTITVDDCGSNMGNWFFAKKGEEHKLLGFNILIGKNQSVLVDKENVGEYMGKRVLLRSPMYCKLDKTDFCKACVGVRLSNSPTSLATAVAHYGDVFLGLFLKSMHSNQLELATLNIEEVLF